MAVLDEHPVAPSRRRPLGWRVADPGRDLAERQQVQQQEGDEIAHPTRVDVQVGLRTWSDTEAQRGAGQRHRDVLGARRRLDADPGEHGPHRGARGVEGRRARAPVCLAGHRGRMHADVRGVEVLQERDEGVTDGPRVEPLAVDPRQQQAQLFGRGQRARGSGHAVDYTGGEERPSTVPVARVPRRRPPDHDPWHGGTRRGTRLPMPWMPRSPAVVRVTLPQARRRWHEPAAPPRHSARRIHEKRHIGVSFVCGYSDEPCARLLLMQINLIGTRRRAAQRATGRPQTQGGGATASLRLPSTRSSTVGAFLVRRGGSRNMLPIAQRQCSPAFAVDNRRARVARARR